ncbi:MAG: ribose transport system ATP-binding protein [Gaiellaceae bacterium]|nr:ribose transport system ATP-binding protein [Gaiellaceae bacterium]
MGGLDLPQPLLTISQLSKTFESQVALRTVSMEIRAGEIYGLVGHNGSGKSTLIKVLAGYHKPDPGASIVVAGRELLQAGSSGGHRSSRMRFIHQDLGLIEGLSTAENLAIGGSGYCRGAAGRIRWRAQYQAARASLARFGLAVDVRRPVGELSPGERTVVAVARALSQSDERGTLLVLDEPTAALHPGEVEVLLTSVRRTAASGGAVLFVSHRLEEVLGVADRIGVLREGALVAEGAAADFTPERLVTLIAGREIAAMQPNPRQLRPDTLLAVRGLQGATLRCLDFDLHKGEILGIAGLLGSGREEVVNILFGAPPPLAGSIAVAGRTLKGISPRSVMAAGIALLPGDRARSLIGVLDVRENLTLPRLKGLWGRWRLDRNAERSEAREWVQRLDVRPPLLDRRVAQLSGGNQQKVALAKWLRTAPQVLLLDEPTRGVDVAAKAEIYRVLREAASGGTGIVMCSTEAKELATLCDRVLVLSGGVVTAELAGAAIDEPSIVAQTLR